MAKKNTEKKTKKPTNNKAKTTKPVKNDNTEDIVVDDIVVNDDEEKSLPTEVEISNIETENPVVENTEELEEVKEEEALIFDPESFKKTIDENLEKEAEPVVAAPAEDIKEEKRNKEIVDAYISDQNGKYEDIPIIPMKRNPKNIFFKVKDTIKRKLNFEN